MLGCLLAAVGETALEVEDFLGGDGLQVSVREGSAELEQEKLIAGVGILFVNWPGGKEDAALWLVPLSFRSSLFLMGTIWGCVEGDCINKGPSARDGFNVPFA